MEKSRSESPDSTWASGGLPVSRERVRQPPESPATRQARPGLGPYQAWIARVTRVSVPESGFKLSDFTAWAGLALVKSTGRRSLSHRDPR